MLPTPPAKVSTVQASVPVASKGYISVGAATNRREARVLHIGNFTWSSGKASAKHLRYHPGTCFGLRPLVTCPVSPRVVGCNFAVCIILLYPRGAW